MNRVRVTLCGVLLLSLSIVSCQRGCARKPLPSAPGAATDKRLSLIAPWIDPSSDVVVIIDLAAASNSTAMEPWVAWLINGPFGKVIQGTSFQIKNQIELVAFQMCVNTDKTFARTVLIQTTEDAARLETESATRAAAEGLQLKAVDRTLLAIGDKDSLALFTGDKRRGIEPSTLEPYRTGSNVTIWGWVDTTQQVKEMLPALWGDVKNISFTVNATDKVNALAKLNFENATGAKAFHATLDWVISMGALLKDDAPWLTELFRSTIVRIDRNNVILEVAIPQEIVM